MNELENILAKSVNYGNVTLIEHTRHVVEAIEKFAKNYSLEFDIHLAKKGAILHDLGKAHPLFQKRIAGINASTLVDERERMQPHRHELSSLAFLPSFPKVEWDDLIELVVGHHKSIEDDPKGRGILDLSNNIRDWISVHLRDWEVWSKFGLLLLRQFKIEVDSISIEQAHNALEYTAEYCSHLGYGWSSHRGLLMSADHFASAFMTDTSTNLSRLFQIPDLSYYQNPQRIHPLFPLSQIDASKTQPHTLVVAPTGGGKTDFLLRRCEGRIFYTLPFQASINAMFDRLRDTIEGDIRLLHATSRVVIGNEITEQILQPMAGASVKVLTPHQLAAIIFGTKGYEMVMLDVKDCDVILDEVHTYSEHSRAMVLEIVRALLRLNCRVHIGTATMPSVLYNKLLALLGGIEAVYEVRLKSEHLDQFDRHRIFKLTEEKLAIRILTEALNSGEKVLYICNTVRHAQETFVLLRELFTDVPILLIHSRYRRKDRVRLESTLKNDLNNQSTYRPCLVIATQVVEVSLDISFDRMITQCAPIDSLIQRFGRVNRIRTIDTIGKYKPVHVIQPGGNVLPYKIDVLKRSYNTLPNDGNILRERDLQDMIDEVYPDIESTSIDVHLIYRNGEYTLRKLCDRKKSVLLEALEVESATCILECDLDAYLTASYQDRIGMEIPVNFRTITRYRNQYVQLEVGSNPFVVPQAEENHMVIGLEFAEQEIIL